MATRDMFNCGHNQYKSWAEGCPFALKWNGPFDPKRTAEQQWKIADFEGKVNPAAFPAFKRGWEAAKLEFAS